LEAAFIHRPQRAWYGGRLLAERCRWPEIVAEGDFQPRRRLALRPASARSSVIVASGSAVALPSQRKPKLIDRVREALRLRHRSPKTEKAYVAWIYRFIVFNDKRHPSEMAAAEIERFLSSLAVERGVSASTQNQALAAILFLYRDVLGIQLPWMDGIVRARRPDRLPIVLTRQEVGALLGELAGRERLMATLLYGSGLRLLECVRLRIKEIDFEKREILEGVQQQYEADLAQDFGGVTLPNAIDRKYPNAGREWPWQYVFPASRLLVDRASGRRLRHHLDESVLQRAVREAAKRARIAKTASCHTLRHYSASRTIAERCGAVHAWVGNRASKGDGTGQSLGIVLLALQAAEEAQQFIPRLIATGCAAESSRLGERLLFHGECGLEIDLGSFHGFVPEPQGDDRTVDT
jgi:integrase